MRASLALQILGVLIAMISTSMFAYINFIAPRTKVDAANEVARSSPAFRNEFRTAKPKRTPSEEEMNQVKETITRLYGSGLVAVVGDPIVVSLHTPEAEEMVLSYELTGENRFTSALDVWDLSSSPLKSVFHLEGEDFLYYPVLVSEGEKEKRYLLVEERTGASGDYLHLSFLEYDGFGKMKAFYSLQDLHAALLYPLQDKLLLERDHLFYEVVKEQTVVRLVEYDLKGLAGFHILSYGVQNGAWYVRHNQEAVPSAEKGLTLSAGEEILLISDPQNEERSVRTLIDGPSLEYVKGPPVSIRAVNAGEGTIRFLNGGGDLEEFTVPVRVTRK